MTLIVNLFAGPGAGKSTLAAGVFHDLKTEGRKVELVTEVAKDFTWADRTKCLKSQPLIFGKQLYRIERLIGKVDVIVTDSPILLSAAYCDAYPKTFSRAILDIFNQFNNLNFYLTRRKFYQPFGRSQNLDEATKLDRKIEAILQEYRVDFEYLDRATLGHNETLESRVIERIYESQTT